MKEHPYRGMAAGLAAVAAGGLALFAGATPAQAANPDPAPLLAAHGRTIADQYIVVLKPNNNGTTVARRHKVTPSHVYSFAVTGFASRMSAKQLSAVRNDPSVAYVAPDGWATPNDKPTPADPSSRVSPRSGTVTGAHPSGATGQFVQGGATWGIDRIDQRNRPLDGLYHYTSTGSGVTAYVIDTGIYTGNAQFGGRASGGWTGIADGHGTDDCNGHGTHVAGTIGGSTYGVAKAVRLVAVRVFPCSGGSPWSTVIAGVDWVTFNHSGPSIANMSLGGGYNQAVNDAVSNSIAQGVTYSIAAGNNGLTTDPNSCNTSPSSTPAALTVAATTVGATTNTDARANFSSWGPCVDLFAPGVNITSSWIGGVNATNTISGTSMAAPHVAGLAALYLQANPYATPATVNAVLTTDAVPGIVADARNSPNRLARKWNGTLTGTGASSYEPDGLWWYQANPGYIQAWLLGTSGTDPDLYLQRWNGSVWVSVAGSASITPNERVVYAATAGYYRVRAYGYAGAGTYDVWATHPA